MIRYKIIVYNEDNDEILFRYDSNDLDSLIDKVSSFGRDKEPIKLEDLPF